MSQLSEEEKKKRLRRTHRNMKARCLNKNHPEYERYGARGITLCPEWMSFAGFWSDMGWTYQDGLTIERIDNNKGYFYENCKWATYKEQNNNRRGNRKMTIDGVTKNMGQWAEAYGVRNGLIAWRLKMGWGDKDAVMTPPRLKKLSPAPNRTLAF